MNNNLQNTGKLYFLIGLPRSGKSTLAKQWQNKEIDIWSSCGNLPRVVINADKIRLALSGDRYNSYTEGMVFTIKQIMARTLLLSGYAVLLDETHTSKTTILKTLSLDINAEWHYVKCSIEECKNRAILTSQPDLIVPIERMSNNLYKLTNCENENYISSKLIDVIENLRNEVKTTNKLFRVV